MPEVTTNRRLDIPRLGRRRLDLDPDSFARLSERVARFLGTGRFLAIQTVIVFVWIVLNVRTRHQCRAGHDQADRAADHRPGVAGGLDHPVPAGGADRSGGGRGRLWTGRAGCGPAAHPGGP